MIDTQNLHSFDQLVRQSGHGWMLDEAGDPEKVITQLSETLARVNDLARKKVHESRIELTGDSLLAEFRKSPYKVQAFIQALGKTASAEMLLMVWRILEGMQIAELQMIYSQENSFKLLVTLRPSYGDLDVESYYSEDIMDAALVRHFGIMKVNNRPVFDGFYAHKVIANS